MQQMVFLLYHLAPQLFMEPYRPELKRNPTPSKTIANKCKKMVKTQQCFDLIKKDNESLRTYYYQQLGLSKEDFEKFWDNLKKKTPTILRLNINMPNIDNFFKKLKSNPSFLKIQSLITKSLNKSHFLESQNALEIQTRPPQTLEEKEAVNQWNRYIQKCSDCGLISKQHFSAILSTLYLDIQVQDTVLDMCAAPGHKASFILQKMCQDKNILPGCLVANDIEYRRVQMLTQTVHESGTVNLIAINHPGQNIPELSNQNSKFEFSKIICDVPCSGDGSIRDIPLKWNLWTNKDAMIWHSLQVLLLMKSVQCLKNNGLLLYSTSSLNPIENQAVVSAIFSEVECGLQIMDIHNMYPIHGHKGLTKWSVLCPKSKTSQKSSLFQKKQKIGESQLIEEDQLNQSFEEVMNFGDVKESQIIKESMFGLKVNEMQKIGIEKTMRILPIDNNSNGFYLALLRKNSDFKWKNKINTESDSHKKQNNTLNSLLDHINHLSIQSNEQSEDKYLSEEYSDSQTQKLQKLNIKCPMPKNREKFKTNKFDNISEADFASIEKFYGLNKQIRDLLFVREGGSQRKVFLVSEGVKKFIDADDKKQLKIVRLGCKVLQKSKQLFAGSQCRYRLCQDGILYLMGMIGKRKIRGTLSFFKWVLEIHSVLHQDIEDQALRKQLKELSQGSFVLYFDEIVNGKRVIDGMVGQNFKTSFHLMISKQNVTSFNSRYL